MQSLDLGVQFDRIQGSHLDHMGGTQMEVQPWFITCPSDKLSFATKTKGFPITEICRWEKKNKNQNENKLINKQGLRGSLTDKLCLFFKTKTRLFGVSSASLNWLGCFKQCSWQVMFTLF